MDRYERIAETRSLDDHGVVFYVRRVSIATTAVVTYRVWEVDQSDHTTIRHLDGTRVGTLMSRGFGAVVTEIADDGARHAAVDQILRSRRQLCHRLIREAFPHLDERDDVETVDGDLYTTEAKRLEEQ